MDATKAEIIDQIREVNMLLIQAKLHVGRAKLARHLKHDGQGGDAGVFHMQGRLLGVLGMSGNSHETTSRDLAFIMGVSPQTIEVLLNKLEMKGLIARSSSTNDNGAFVVSLTESGREVLRQIKENRDEAPDILDCLNAEELAQFDGYLQRIVRNAEQKYSDDEFSERRRAMREFLSLMHPDQVEASGAQEYCARVQAQRVSTPAQEYGR